ncbi:MAG: sigma-70 family RNA polymerase sigma factor [Candidatus Eisenbacteria bacterium]|uniref:Sigma-70 family RNA polymerase sigma factor n=1 Tax=Eiseniibacteriota bacterium TaxID=2212470 RepID=A0A956SHL2_UNCEI|nr:sigma-70 family RNA polymerase sigma factor [Candidatus Eisenbacteria bacterium]
MPNEPNARRAEASVLLGRVRSGDDDAAEELLALVYDELRRIAASHFVAQPQDHTLQPTALVHEAFMKLANVPASDWESVNHFKAVAARAMRQVLTDHARAKASAKRSADPGLAHVEGIDTPAGTKTLDLVALERALTKLGELDPRQHQIIELWFFAGLTMGEVAGVIDVSERTVRREWRIARAWLNHQLSVDSL